MLTDAQLEQYDRDGFLVFDKLVPPDEIDALVAQTEAQVDAPSDGVFIESEPQFRDFPDASVPALDRIRKIEKLVLHDDLYLRLAIHPEIFPRMQDILGENIRRFRDALMMKPAHHGTEKPYHQDSPYWKIEPMSLCSIWLAYDRATEENGTMRVIPGSHKQGAVEHVRMDHLQVEDSKIDWDNEVTVNLEKGGCLFFHSLLLHATSPNRSDRPRKAMVVSYMNAEEHRWTGEEPEPTDEFINLTEVYAAGVG
jgi:phytanoyl-CoA hydroxylase